MLKYFVLSLLFIPLFSCGSSTDQNKDYEANHEFSLVRSPSGQPIEKNWGEGSLIIRENSLHMETLYIPKIENGRVSLPLCATIPDDALLGRFICNSDESTQDILGKHVHRVCRNSTSETLIAPASQRLSEENCSTGKATYYEINHHFLYTIRKQS